jgi:hypothetical protein
MAPKQKTGEAAISASPVSCFGSPLFLHVALSSLPAIPKARRPNRATCQQQPG